MVEQDARSDQRFAVSRHVDGLVWGTRWKTIFAIFVVVRGESVRRVKAESSSQMGAGRKGNWHITLLPLERRTGKWIIC